MNKDLVITAVFVVAVVSIALGWRSQPPMTMHAEWTQILHDLRHECDPANPEADYSWNQRSMPTERKREAIIQRCRGLGAKLLPKVRGVLEFEQDDEVRGMLTVIEAALGDSTACVLAAKEMVWSDFPALKISAARTLRRLHDPQTIPWFRIALKDGHFIVNGGCGSYRELFFPVRTLAQIALREMGVEPLDAGEIYRRTKIEVLTKEIAQEKSEDMKLIKTEMLRILLRQRD
ncbi:MAG TPA: hypothetical protein DDZ88_14255 [Verrucomicrobiales bacterium]|nr:hypothetical protein [Verrucomicrobiales bacterium]